MHTFNRMAILAAALALSAAATNGQERAIEQGKTFGDLSGAEGQLTLLRLDVPGGVDGMAIETWGGQGNLDLFVRQGKAPDGKHFDYQSASPTNTERASIPNPQEGAWYIGLYARAAFSGASVRVTFQGVSGPPIPMPVAPEPVAGPLVQTQPAPVLSAPTSQPAAPEPALGPPSPRMPSGPLPLVTPPPPVAVAPPPPPAVPLDAIPALTNGQRSALSGAAAEGFTFRFSVPPGATRLRLALEGGQGEADLYVHFGTPPLPDRFSDRASRTASAPSAVCEILDPAEGLWFVRVQGTSPFKDLALCVTCEPAPLPSATKPAP